MQDEGDEEDQGAEGRFCAADLGCVHVVPRQALSKSCGVRVASARTPPIYLTFRRAARVSATELEYDLDAPVLLHPLVYFQEGDEVTIGRRDTDSYGIFPPDGAEIVRLLEAGRTPREVTAWYEKQYAEELDIVHILAALDELELTRAPSDAPADAGPVRWQRLGHALFSPAAWLVYAALLASTIGLMVTTPELLPRAQHLFFTDYYTLIELSLYICAIPLILLHEAFHALAGRRLGLRSRLRISRRLYYIVFETALDGLVTVPRGRRYLPILAGMVFDVLAFCVLTISAHFSRHPDGELNLFGRMCLAFAFATVLRILWQFFFYLRTDLYALITTVLGCVDLHTTARRLLRNRILRAVGWHERTVSEAEWHPVDRRVAGWYSWLIVIGYTVSIGTFLVALLPVVYQMFVGAFNRFLGSDAPWDALLDSAVFLGMNLLQIAITVVLAIRERRQRRHMQHVIA